MRTFNRNTLSHRAVRLFASKSPQYSLWFLWLSLCASAFAQDRSAPILIFNPITVQLGPSGTRALTVAEMAEIAKGSSDPSGITNIAVTPKTLTVCDIGSRSVTLSLTDACGNTTNQVGVLQVLPPAAPSRVYVDARYPSVCGPVSFPPGGTNGQHFVGFDAFNTIQAALDSVADDGSVYVGPGTYPESLVITKPVFLLGPNVGVPGIGNRRPEACVIPLHSDPENAPIISVETDDVVIDGFLLDGHNAALAGGYNANGVRVHAAAGVQNGTYPDLADVEGITIRNNIITNISYDGICLDRYQYFGTSSGWNYIRNNKLANMWEGILTYSLDAVIANNVISNVTHGLSVHCVVAAAPKGFTPLVASNTLWIAQWWPVEIDPARAPGVWINFRRDRASPLDVVGNVVHTPVSPPSLKTIIGFYALTIDQGATVNFLDNTVKGADNCTVGFLAGSCWGNQAVRLIGGSLQNIRGIGLQATTLDAKWGPGDCRVTVSNVDITMSPGGIGILALQDNATFSNAAAVEVTGSGRISGGACGVQVSGTNSCGSLVGALTISGNDVGINVNAGRALIEGNTLTNNRTAAITAENGAAVDAGDCLGTDLTGLSTGSGNNGASAGANDLSGYGCDRVAPWAIRNTSAIPVLADGNRFNAAPDDNLQDAISGPVQFSDAGTLSVSAPPAIQVECIGQVPPGAKTVQEFIAAGGTVTSGSANGVTSRDLIVTNRPGYYTISRRYSVSGGCSQRVNCDQLITARDDQAPTLLCSGNILQAADQGCDYATITFTNLAADSCGELLSPWVPVTTGRFPIGTNRVIVIATDLANNSTACTFEVAVVGPPVITRQPTSRTNLAGTIASFNVVASSAAPMSFQWNRDGVALRDSSKITGASSAEVTIASVTASDQADYQVDVSNFAGTTSSSKARLTVIDAPGCLRLLQCERGSLTLQMSEPAGNRFAILTSTNLADWVAIHTNIAPFALVYTNLPWASCRFFRALPAPLP